MCSHRWLANGIESPEQCPKCKKRKWHTKITSHHAEFMKPEQTVVVEHRKVDMAALRAICAIPAATPEPIEEQLCGFRSFNEGDGEYYICGMPDKHGIKHGSWIRE